MGDYNQYLWVDKLSNNIKGPILEIGARHYDSITNIDYRKLFPNEEYYGVDFQKGKNVDIQIDITWDLRKIQELLPHNQFSCIICNSVLEHVDNIFVAAKNITGLLKPNGQLIISVPFVWEEHGYPNDFWRFTPNGIKYLFPDLKFNDKTATISSDSHNDIEYLYKEDSDINSFLLRENIFQINSETKSKIKRKIYRLTKFISNADFRFEYINRIFFRKKNLLKKCCINMIGTK